jgi:hypothetical protein
MNESSGSARNLQFTIQVSVTPQRVNPQDLEIREYAETNGNVGGQLKKSGWRVLIASRID